MGASTILLIVFLVVLALLVGVLLGYSSNTTNGNARGSGSAGTTAHQVQANPANTNKKHHLSPGSVLGPQVQSSSLTGQTGEDTGAVRLSHVAIPSSDDRPNPSHRGNKAILKQESELRTKLKVHKIWSCLWWQSPNGAEKMNGGELVYDERCAGSDTLLVENPSDQDRFVCGQKLPAHQTLRIDQETCGDVRLATRVYQSDASLENKMAVAHIQIGNKYGDGMVGGKQFPGCDVPCYKNSHDGILTEPKIEGTPFTFTYSMEGEAYYEELHVDPMAYRDNRYYATTSFKSDVPLPYYSWAEYNISQPAVEYDKAIQGASFLAGNCGSTSHREEVVKELTKILRVDSLGRCLRNASPPNGLGLGNKIKIQQQYLFHLAFENSIIPDYITEKLWGTFQSGTLPVYMGAPNVKEHAPPNSIISWHDFGSTKELGEYLVKVAANKTLYESYHTWRTKPLSEQFVQKFNFTHTHSICRICRWSHAKTNGFGWDHTTQTVQLTRLQRRVCTDNNNLIEYPFREQGANESPSSSLSREEKDQCAHSNEILVGETGVFQGDKWERSVQVHDGVIDLSFKAGMNTGSSRTTVSMYELTFTLFPELRQVDLIRDHYQQTRHQFLVLQDDLRGIRFLIITRQEAEVSFQAKGKDISPRLWFELSGDELHVRIVMNDADTFHTDADRTFTYYEEKMKDEFLHPLQTYVEVE